MDLAGASLDTVLPSLTGLLIAIGALAGGTVTVREYRLKARALTDEARARAVETDVRLAEAFARLIPLANGRSESHLSELAAQVLLAQYEGKEVSGDEIRRTLAFAITNTPVGEATQVAAIALVGELARRHPETLAIPALSALRSFRDDFSDYEALAGAVDLAFARAQEVAQAVHPLVHTQESENAN